MEIVWHILLTVCMNEYSSCLKQDVEHFKDEATCEERLIMYREMPTDGHWEYVSYDCKPLNAVEA